MITKKSFHFSHTDMSYFTWSKGKHGTLAIHSRKTGQTYIRYIDRWCQSVKHTDPAIAITADPLEAVKPV